VEIAFQMLELENGQRSEVMRCERDALAKRLSSMPGDKQDQLAVLVIMEKTGEEWKFSMAPFYKVPTFIQYFG